MTWLTLADDGYVNIHDHKPVTHRSRTGQYQDDYLYSLPYAAIRRLVDVELQYWQPVEYQPQKPFKVQLKEGD